MSRNNKVGFVSLVGAGPGDPGLITLRAASCLRLAEAVVYDRLANPLLLRLAPDAELISVGKQPGCHPIPQEEINALLVQLARQGKQVVRLKGGDPFVFGRGGEEAQALAAAHIPFEIIPGITSAISVPAYAGIPLTQRGIANSLAVITGHHSESTSVSEDEWQRKCWTADSLVFLMGVKNLPQIVDQLLKAGKPAETPVAVIERGTTASQKTISGSLADIIQHAADIRPPAVIVVGEVVRLRELLRWYDNLESRPLFGLRVLSTKTFPETGKTNIHGMDMPFDDFDNQVYALGGETIRLPVIQIAPTTSPEAFKTAVEKLATGNTYHWLVFTSAAGVTSTFNQLNSLGYDARSLKGVKVAAVGKATVEVLKNHGIHPDFVPTQYTGADLGRELPTLPGEALCLPRSEIALPELPNILKERGSVVDEVIAYSVRPNHPDKIILDQLVTQEINAVAFFSPSGVKGLAEMLSIAGYSASLAEILSPITVACIGPSTQAAALRLKVRVDITAHEHTSAGLVKELVKWQKR